MVWFGNNVYIKNDTDLEHLGMGCILLFIILYILIIKRKT